MMGKSMSTGASAVRKIAGNMLAVSEPPPYMFGNPANESNSVVWTNANWLKSRFHFSFAEYYNPKNSSFGVLRVMNDDLVQPDRGFGTHPHANMEIATYVVNGSLTHKDSMGTEESLSRGSIQFMTAGTGVRHSEYNLDKSTPLRFIQMWIVPRTRSLQPNYGSMSGEQSPSRLNQWAHLVSDVKSTVLTPVKINQDVNIYVAEIAQGNTLALEIKASRQAYFLQIEGQSQIKNGSETVVLDQHEAAELYAGLRADENSLQLEVSANGDSTAHCLVVEMKQDGNGGRF
mmetsp:Transcript_36523/g.37193  ORF Transcript_36523/g.37193 Transcript_36523/m.37193 type:complete len:288 (+) Transcript_36523:1-864(+)